MKKTKKKATPEKGWYKCIKAPEGELAALGGPVAKGQVMFIEKVKASKEYFKPCDAPKKGEAVKAAAGPGTDKKEVKDYG